jgi:hypothetical protein
VYVDRVTVSSRLGTLLELFGRREEEQERY